MTYTYTSQNNLITIVALEENEIKVKTIKNSNEELDIYDYNEISSIHLSVREENWYNINIVFNDGYKVHLKSVTFEKSKFLGSKIMQQPKDYLYWVLFLHDKILEKNLETKIKFTQGNSLLFIILLVLMSIIVFVIVPGLIKNSWYSLFFTVIIPSSIFLISYMYHIGFQKKYNPTQLPLKYLPKVIK
jgi:hypothetical protein